MNATSHFQTRAQQRAISAPMVEMIFNLGQVNGRGDLVLLGEKDIDQAVRNLKALLQDLSKMRAHGGAGIAFDGNTLITTFHRHKKFKRS